MAKREGYISIISLFTMCILMIISSYLVYAAYLEDLILINTKNKIQSFYLSEGKIHMILLDKYYTDEIYPFLLETFRSNKLKTATKNIILNKNDLDEFDSLSKVEISFKDNNKTEIVIKSSTDYKNLKTNIIASGTVVNKFFEMGIPILDSSNIDFLYKKEFEELLTKINKEIDIDYSTKPLNIYGGKFSDFDSIVLNQISLGNYYISAYRETMIGPYVEHIDKNNIILIIKGDENNKVNLQLGNENELNRAMELNGLIYVEGNITIFNNLNFNGIIIIKDGNIIVNSTNKPKINGIIINYGENSSGLNSDLIEVIYNRDIIFKYGTYIPGFIEIQIDLYKSN